MQKIIGCILVVILFGCKNFETNKISSEEILQEQLRQIDWKEVENYPTFPECENCNDKEAQKRCFQQKLSSHIYASLAKHQVIISDSVEEKIWLQLTFSAEGKPSLDSVRSTSVLKQEIPQLQEWLDSAVMDLPKIYPAQKRGIPVKTSFKLPLLITS